MKICKHCGKEIPAERILKSRSEVLFCTHKCARDSWYKAHRETRLVQIAEYRRRNPHVALNARRKWARLNPEKIALYREKNKRSLYLKSLEWARSNRERRRASCKKYRESHPDRHRAQTKAANARRRAATRGSAVVSCGISKWIELIKSKSRTRCYWCRKSISTKHYHIDHIVPIIEGGKHELGNLCVSCAPCNLSKGRKLLSDWSPKLSALF